MSVKIEPRILRVLNELIAAIASYSSASYTDVVMALIYEDQKSQKEAAATIQNETLSRIVRESKDFSVEEISSIKEVPDSQIVREKPVEVVFASGNKTQEDSAGKSLYVHTCPVCGKEFSASRDNTVYCSKKCKRVSEVQRRRKEPSEKEKQESKPDPQIYEKTCPVCGKSFKTKFPKKKYCSDSCKRKVHNEQEKKRQQEIRQKRREAKSLDKAKFPVPHEINSMDKPLVERVVAAEPSKSQITNAPYKPCERKNECFFGDSKTCNFYLYVGRSKKRDAEGVCTEFLPQNNAARKIVAGRSAKGFFTSTERIGEIIKDQKGI